MNWVILALLAPFAFVGFQSLSKLLSKDLSSFFVTALAFALGTVVMFLGTFLSEKNLPFASMTPRDWWLAAGIGVLLAVGNMLVIKAFALGAPQGQLSVLFNAVYVLGGFAFGVLFFQEKINAWQLFGMLLAMVGIFLVAYFRA